MTSCSVNTIPKIDERSQRNEKIPEDGRGLSFLQIEFYAIANDVEIIRRE